MPRLRSLACVLALIVGTSACAAIEHPSVVVPPPVSKEAPGSWDDVFARPADVTVDVVVSARWAVPRKGVLDQHDARAHEAGPPGEKVPIVLPIGVVRHATAGDFLVDTGVERAIARGERGAQRGLLRAFLRKIEPVTSLGEVMERDRLKVAGVLLTHLHVDHVLGMPDIPAGTPIWVGPGEPASHQRFGGLQRRTFRELFRGQAPFRELPATGGIALGPIPRAIDLLGDGSIWAIPSPGHTPGSMAWLVNATAGPVLFVGDTSHTQWGWDHDVTPGTYSADHVANAESLAHLRALARRYPQIRVVLGHQLS